MDLSTLGIDGITALLLVGFVMGFVELAKALVDREWRRAIIIAVAGVAGAAVSFLIGIPVVTGIVGGLAASGAITLAQNFSASPMSFIELADEPAVEEPKKTKKTKKTK